MSSTDADEVIPPASPACVDAETLAAWSEGALPPDLAAAVELHLADCARCQMMMAVFARAEPAAAAAVVPFPRRWSIPVWIPLVAGTLAASLLIWIAWPSRAEIPSTVAAPPTLASAPAPAAVPQGAPASSKQKALEDRKEVPSTAMEAKASTATGELSASLPRSQGQGQGPAASAPPPAAAAVVGANDRTITAAGATQNAADAATRAPVFRASVEPPPSAIVAEFSSPDRAPAGAVSVAGSAGGFGGSRGGGGGGGGGGGRGGRGGGLAVPAAIRWRIFASGAVERSVNAGVTWEAVTIEPAAQQLTAGAAPTPLVCWLVGRGGAVLRTTDALHLVRLTFPETVDLVSVRATGASEATVTTVDGRTFTTVDGGVTWRSGGQVLFLNIATTVVVAMSRNKT